MEPSSLYARPRTAVEPGSKSTIFNSSTPAYLHAQNQARVSDRSSRESGEVISNLIFSLSPISNQSERLLEKILPAQDNPSARLKRRAHTSYSPRDAPPLLSPLIREEIVVADKHRELPTVDEAGPSSPTVVSKRQKPKSLPPPIAVPRRSMSLRATAQAPAIVETRSEVGGDAGDGFGSVSVLPGRAHSPSMVSDKETRRNIIGRSPSRAKSTKSRIKELDAERKKRLSTKNIPRSPGFPAKSNKAQHSPSLSKSSSAVPRTSNVSEERSASSARAPFLRHISNPPSRTTSALGFSDGYARSEATDVELSDFAKPRRLGGPAGGVNLVIPARSSSKQSMDVDQHTLSMSATSQHRAQSRQSKRRNDISKLAAERDEAGTTQRIQELRAQKELRNRLAATRPASPDRREEESLAATRPDSPDLDAEDESAHVTPEDFNSNLKLGSAEPRDSSSQQKRSMSNLGAYPRPSVDVDAFTVADSIDEDVDQYLSDPRLSQKIYHQDTGRCVSYSDVGDPNGFVIICCVGMGTSRFVTAFYDELSQTLGLRLITPERPGIGDSEPYMPGEVDTPLGWPDDIRLICQHLNISRFSLLAHSAGSIYALATALRMPANIRGRVHILAPWIPPSQLMAIGHNEEPVPVAELPLIQRILRSIPEAWLEAATRVFNMSSITSSLGKSPYAKRRRNTMPNGEKRPNRGETPAIPPNDDDAVHSAPASPTTQLPPEEPVPAFDLDLDTLTAEERAAEYDRRLTAMIWQLATSNANPAVDLTVCLERKQEIGFRYEDITKPIVLHHGTKDTRVHVDNVIWLGENMRRCEVRILENEGHGLMANARVMYSVLSEMAQDWRDWNAVVKGKK